MKTQLTRLRRKVVPGLTLAALLASSGLKAQTQAPAADAAAASTDAAPQKLSAADLNDLLGPIALYPDALVSLILPASTVPSDITMAARYLAQNGNDADVSGQSWDPSVRSLAEYPDVLKWMDDNLEWTTSLGEAFVEQPADVMNSIQALRLAAREKGNLKNTPQQTVVVEKPAASETAATTQEVIRIVPADPEVIYVPVYDPQVVYVQEYQPDYTPLITFGVGLAVGSWLNYDCNWWGRNVYYGPGCGWNNRNRWNDRGYYDRGQNVNVVNTNTNIVNNNVNNFTTNNTTINRWQPSAASQRQFNQRQRDGIGNTRIARANAKAASAPNVQQALPSSKHVRPAAVARPNRPDAITQNKRPGNKVAGNSGGNKSAPGKAPNANRGNPQAVSTSKPGANTNKPSHGTKPKAPSSAPKINGTSGGKRPSATHRPDGSMNRGNPNADKPKKPTSVPGAQAGNRNKPDHSGTASNRPKQPQKPARPSAAPSQPKPQQSNPRPQAQPRPQQPKPRPQAASHPKPKPQQAAPKPQQSKPKPQAQPRPQQQSKPKPQAQSRPQPRPQQMKPQQQPRPQAQPRPQQQGGKGENKKKKKNND